MIPYDWDQPASWELQVIPDEKTHNKTQSVKLQWWQKGCTAHVFVCNLTHSRWCWVAQHPGQLQAPCFLQLLLQPCPTHHWKGTEEWTAGLPETARTIQDTTQRLRHMFRFLTHIVIYNVLWLYFCHNGVSLFSCNSVEAAQDLQHKRPGGVEAIGQPFFYDTGRHIQLSCKAFTCSPYQDKRRIETSLENIPKHFADVRGISCRGCGTDYAHFFHVRGNTFSQQSLKKINHNKSSTDILHSLQKLNWLVKLP